MQLPKQQTIFDIASATKVVAATPAIALLYQWGDIKLGLHLKIVVHVVFSLFSLAPPSNTTTTPTQMTLFLTTFPTLDKEGRTK